jgi:hypothetical protein
MDILCYAIPVVGAIILGILLIRWAIISNKAINDLK